MGNIPSLAATCARPVAPQLAEVRQHLVDEQLHRSSVEEAGGKATQETHHLVRRLLVPGGELEPAPAGGGQSGVAPRRAVKKDELAIEGGEMIVDGLPGAGVLSFRSVGLG